MNTATLVVIGAGSRGTGYAGYALGHPNHARVVGVAEPREGWRAPLAAAHGIPTDNVAHDWRELADRPRFADAVVIATPDAHHAAPAVAFAEKGYHILLEKPMAPNADDCRRIVEAVHAAGTIFAVCHVLRYTRFTRALKQLVDSGRIGDLVSLQLLEPVGYWHQAHSFVRGNWRRADKSSPMILAKCCHDLDWIRHVIGAPCAAIQSFGNLKHFRPEQAPAGAADRCLDCPVEAECAYSAKKIYLGRLAKGHSGWPLHVLTTDVTEAGITEALRSGPYGRCVYHCDNDVVDHQVVNMQFANGQTATLTMTAFTEADHRQVRIFGTRGQLAGDGRMIRQFDFLTDRWEEIDTEANAPSILTGHGGGDYGLMHAFVDALRHQDPDRILSGPDETLETHLMAFAAETSRHENRVVSLPDFQ